MSTGPPGGMEAPNHKSHWLQIDFDQRSFICTFSFTVSLRSKTQNLKQIIWHEGARRPSQYHSNVRENMDQH
ncbi:hypothetical protein GN956_G25080 [Arapaima gigas]